MPKEANKKNLKNAPRKKVKRSLFSGVVYIQSSFNNTIVSVTDEDGGVVSWSSSGAMGFKGTKKSTPYAAQLTTQSAIEKAKSYGLKKIKVFVSGVGAGRESAVRALVASGLEIELLKDTTPIPHNGCRSKKTRRI